jgi:DHA1 family tetracycline resistance protein-like MFS transporter
MIILFVVLVLSTMGFGLVLPPFIFVAQNFGASTMFAAFIVSTFAMGQFIATPVWGKLSDRYGRKPILILTMLGSAGANALMALADAQGDVRLLLASRFLTGLMAGNFAVATAYMADITSSENRAQGMGMVGGAISVGFMAGPAIGGLMSGNTAETASLYWPSLAASFASLATLVAIVLFLKESLPPEQRTAANSHEQEKARKKSSSFGQIMSRPVLAPMVIMGFLMFFAITNFETTFPIWADAGFGWGPQQVGFSFMWLGFVVMVTQIFIVGKLAPIFGEGHLLQAAVCSYVFGLLFMAIVPFAFEPAEWKVMMFGITFTAFGSAMFNTAATSWVSKQAGDQERGAVIGLFQSAGWLGRSVGPTVSGFLFQTFGPNSPLYAGALLMAPVFMIVTLIRRRHAASEAAKEASGE